jgi:hypothetical protein
MSSRKVRRYATVSMNSRYLSEFGSSLDEVAIIIGSGGGSSSGGYDGLKYDRNESKLDE